MPSSNSNPPPSSPPPPPSGTAMEELARQLHYHLGLTLQELLDKIRAGDVEQGTASILNVIRQYVKDANVKFDADLADKGDPVFKLAQELDLPDNHDEGEEEESAA